MISTLFKCLVKNQSTSFCVVLCLLFLSLDLTCGGSVGVVRATANSSGVADQGQHRGRKEEHREHNENDRPCGEKAAGELVGISATESVAAQCFSFGSGLGVSVGRRSEYCHDNGKSENDVCDSEHFCFSVCERVFFFFVIR